MKKYKIRGIILALVVTGLHLLASRSELFTSLENGALDLRFSLRGPIPKRAETDPVMGDIIIVAVDEWSFKKLGINWPFPPSMHAKLITRLADAGAAVIAFDNIHPQPAPGCMAKEEPLLAKAVEKAGNVVWGAKVRADGTLYDKPIPGLAKACAAIGYLNMPQDPDGTLRRALVKIGKTPSFALAIASVYADPVTASRNVEPGKDYRINYRGGPKTYTTLSYSDVYLGTIPGGFSFEDKIVLIGPTAPELQDNKEHPFGPGATMPGVEVHANIVDNLLSARHWISEAPSWVNTLVLLAACMMATGFVLLLSPIRAALLVMVVAGGYAVTDYWLFAFHDYELNLVGPLLAIPTVYIFMAGYRLITEQAARARLKATFSRYVSPDVVKELIQDPEKIKLGGEKKELTVLFSDIRGFTSISERMAPEALVPFLNDYLSAMSACILERRGMLDKYIGDAIMAVWGAPLPNPSHPSDACFAAIEMKTRLARLRPMWEARGLPSLKAGIGINTGAMVVGNIGSNQKMDFTVIGDEVNLGSRLEGLTKQYGVEIIVSQNTVAKLDGEHFTFRLLDKVTVKGKKEPIDIFELLGYKETEIDLKAWLDPFERGLKLYHSMKWEEAREAFSAADRSRDGGDAPSRLYMQRIALIEQDPPSQDWDGVWRWKTK
ncbi:MAG: adenylate/guanylate cyclase domain-containing protein [Deltaproteobacteria bacterium]|nr:adenylate/guanylate cyclase domain-containing protein [Deltaproteobacteria bacterium]